jgi:hypothetical protein
MAGPMGEGSGIGWFRVVGWEWRGRYKRGAVRLALLFPP